MSVYLIIAVEMFVIIGSAFVAYELLNPDYHYNMPKDASRTVKAGFVCVIVLCLIVGVDCAGHIFDVWFGIV